MEIVNNRKKERPTLVKELAIGEVFTLIDKEDFDESDVFMKGDLGIVNLRTGYMYAGMGQKAVKKVKAKLVIE